MKRVLIAGIITVSLLSAGFLSRAADDTTPAPTSSSSRTEKRVKQMPFRGKLVAVDATARTVTLSGKEKNRLLRVTDESRIRKDGKSISLEEVRAGESVGGLAQANASGDWEVVTLNVGPKPTKTASPAEAAE